ncbi:hypothetical protein Patl1_33026 [Pistacia atlantica]|uniref:Uncharacterized protein n=1 Tax=Pistacia atlantica TaxID=434234 RepID=A0ACC1AP22_9ROSI|nr:hypothetical protein Patl1_33026 [Pistacia atlantica]
MGRVQILVEAIGMELSALIRVQSPFNLLAWEWRALCLQTSEFYPTFKLWLTGPLPTSIGNLKKLTTLILVGCSFSGQIPASIGSLQQLVFLKKSTLRFNPRSTVQSKHDSDTSVRLQSYSIANQLTGKIPSSLGLVQILEVLRLDRNSLNGHVP